MHHANKKNNLQLAKARVEAKTPVNTIVSAKK
jgi:hypothetical protein